MDNQSGNGAGEATQPRAKAAPKPMLGLATEINPRLFRRRRRCRQKSAVDTMKTFETMGREELLRALAMFAKNWLAHDGCWFLAAEERFGIDTAIELDASSWARFAAAEARRIMATFGIPAGGGLPALEEALALRLYSVVNAQRVEWSEDRQRLRFFMDRCRVQEARQRKGLPDFSCNPVGTVEFETFAKTVDPRIVTRCLQCPPNAPEGQSCAWEFTLGS